MKELISTFLPILLGMLGLVILVGLGVGVALLLKGKRGESPNPYEAGASLLSPSEQLFFASLQEAVAGRWWIFPKVRLEDIIQVRKGLDPKKAYGYRNRIKSRHVDFVICEAGTYRCLAAVELDDASHKRRDRQERDLFVDESLRGAEIPCLHFKVRNSYIAVEIQAELDATLIPADNTVG